MYLVSRPALFYLQPSFLVPAQFWFFPKKMRLWDIEQHSNEEAEVV